MQPNVCSWRTLRVLAAAAVLLYVFAGNVHAQEGRRNRVWSLHISFILCGATLDSVRIAQVDLNGEIGPWQNANKELIIIQWSRNLPFKQGEDHLVKYTLHDLLADFGQTRYVLQLIGRGSMEDTRFSKFLWVSPVGLSKTPIPLAPIREDRDLDWTDEEHEESSSWYSSHTWIHGRFFREFSLLVAKADKKLDLSIRVQSNLENCEPVEEEGGENDERRHVVVFASNSARRVDRV